MRKKHFIKLCLLVALTGLMFVSCEDETSPVVVDESLLMGYWYVSDNSKEMWRFDRDHTGETWDLSEDVQEGEGTKFDWNSTQNQLRIDLHGEMGMHVFYDYTVTRQSYSELTFKDIYGNSRTFLRKQL